MWSYSCLCSKKKKLEKRYAGIPFLDAGEYVYAGAPFQLVHLYHSSGEQSHLDTELFVFTSQLIRGSQKLFIIIIIIECRMSEVANKKKRGDLK